MLNDSRPEDQVVPIAYPPALAALACGRSRTRIYKAIGDGELVARKDGRATLIERTELERWIKAMNPYQPWLERREEVAAEQVTQAAAVIAGEAR
jgi:excisionase family DNA binding protein